MVAVAQLCNCVFQKKGPQHISKIVCGLLYFLKSILDKKIFYLLLFFFLSCVFVTYYFVKLILN